MLSWNCINCESANDYNHTKCEVCGYDRYYSIQEVNDLLKSQQESPTDIKKIQTNYKRVNTVNKKIRQENKELLQKMDELQDFHDNYSDDMQLLEDNVQELRKSNLRLKIWLTISGIIILFFILAKVSVTINF